MAHKNKKPAAKLKQSGRLAKSSLKFGRGRARGEKQRPDSLKAQMRELASRIDTTESDLQLRTAAENWLHNKRANTSRPQQGIGRTNRVRKGDSKKGG